MATESRSSSSGVDMCLFYLLGQNSGFWLRRSEFGLNSFRGLVQFGSLAEQKLFGEFG